MVNDKVTVFSGRDLSHNLIRREASRDSTKVKKGTTNGSVPSPRKIRRVVPKPEKPRWLTIVSFFAKNFFLLLLLIVLVQLVRRLATKAGDTDSSMAFLEVEGRIAEVESLVKSTAKMIQVQVEVLDKKIEKEVGGLRKETQDVVDRKGAVYDRQLKELAGRSQVLEKHVEEFKAADWLSKDEFNRFYVGIMKGKDIKGDKLGDNDLSLDDVRAYAREIVRKEIEKHAADGLGMVDYALASAGGKVMKHSGTINWFLGGVHPDADKMLKPSFGEPGQCFPLKGSAGFVQIALRTPIVPQAFTLEHVAKSVAYDRSSAPKDCRVSGWLQGRDTEKRLLLAEFTYDLEKSNAQTFDVLDSAASGVVDMIRLDFTSNHGSLSHTCLYRFRVHGYEPDSASLTAM